MTAAQRNTDGRIISRIAVAGAFVLVAEDLLEGSREMLQALQPGDTGEAV